MIPDEDMKADEPIIVGGEPQDEINWPAKIAALFNQDFDPLWENNE